MLPNVPIGTITAWVRKLDNTTFVENVDLPDGWMFCNGATIPNGSIWAGRKVPDLNGERRFLRGGSEAEMLTLEDDQIIEHSHILEDSPHSHSYEDIYYDDAHHGYGPLFYNPFNDNYDTEHYPETTEPASTGITITGVSSDYNHGEENRPKNMGVIWIIRVW